MNGFFTLSVAQLEILDRKIDESEIIVEVSHYKGPIEGSGGLGVAEKIWLSEKLIYQNEK